MLTNSHSLSRGLKIQLYKYLGDSFSNTCLHHNEVEAPPFGSLGSSSHSLEINVVIKSVMSDVNSMNSNIITWFWGSVNPRDWNPLWGGAYLLKGSFKDPGHSVLFYHKIYLIDFCDFVTVLFRQCRCWQWWGRNSDHTPAIFTRCYWKDKKHPKKYLYLKMNSGQL